MIQLSQEQKQTLSSLLIRCPCLKTVEGRQNVIEQLPDNIQPAIKHAPTIKAHVLNILDTCLNYQDGLSELVKAVGFFEDNSLPFQAVKQWVDGLNRDKPSPSSRLPGPPPPPAHFAGRQQKLAELKTALSADTGGVVALTAVQGLGGIGKTTLARRLANEVWPQPFAAVLWTEIKPHPTARSLLKAWVDYFDPAFSFDGLSDEQAARLIRQGLEGLVETSRTLVVFDDVWDDEGVAAVRLLLEAIPAHSSVLLTTRQARVGQRLDAETVDLARLPTDEAVTLLNQYLKVKDLPQADLERLATLLGGHALALTLAAKRLNLEARPTQALPRHLTQYEKGLPEGNAVRLLALEQDTTYKEENLALALGFSYQALKDDQKTRFRALGALVYDQPFDLRLLAALWEAEDTEDQEATEQAREWANELRNLSLLESATETELNEDWYRQHPLLYDLAVRLLKSDPTELAAARDRYHDASILIAEGFRKLPPEEWKEQLDPYLPHVEATGAALVLSYPDLNAPATTFNRALAFALNIPVYLARRREVWHGEWLEMGLAISRHLGDKESESLFLHELGSFYSALGDKYKALDYYNQSLFIIKILGDQSGEAVTLGNIGSVYQALGEMHKALEYHEQSLILKGQVGDKSGLASTLSNIGVVYIALGESEKALNYLRQSLVLRRTIGDQSGEAVTLGNIGSVYQDLGNMQKALEYHEQSLTLERQVGNRGGEAATLSNIGSIYQVLGEMQKALEYYQQALILKRAVGDRGAEAITLNNIGLIYRRLGKNEKALSYYNQALLLHQAVSDRDGEAYTYNNIGMIYWQQGKQQAAIEFVEQAIDLWRAVRSPMVQVAEANLAEMRQILKQEV